MSLMTYRVKQMIIQDDNFVDLNKLLINKVSSDYMKISSPVINSQILKLKIAFIWCVLHFKEQPYIIERGKYGKRK
jgi:hypothetical protein